MQRVPSKYKRPHLSIRTNAFTETITPAQYADAVVEEALKSKPKAWFWYGARTGMCRYGDMFLPRTYWVSLSVHSYACQDLIGSIRTACSGSGSILTHSLRIEQNWCNLDYVRYVAYIRQVSKLLVEPLGLNLYQVLAEDIQFEGSFTGLYGGLYT